MLPNVAAVVYSISPILCHGCVGRREEAEGEEIRKGKKGDVKKFKQTRKRNKKKGKDRGALDYHGWTSLCYEWLQNEKEKEKK